MGRTQEHRDATEYERLLVMTLAESEADRSNLIRERDVLKARCERLQWIIDALRINDPDMVNRTERLFKELHGASLKREDG